MNIKVCCFIFLFTVAVMPGYADMYSALGDVYRSNPVIGQGRAAVDVALAELDLARTGYKPYLGVSGSIGVARSQILGNDYDYVPKQFGAEFQQNVFQGGAIIAQIKAAKGMLASQQALLYNTQQDVFLSAINAYINVLNADQVFKLNQSNQRVLQEYYDFISGRADAGLLTKTDSSQASARLAQAQYATIEADAQYENALETFVRIYGNTQDKYTEINLESVRHLMPENVEDAEKYAMRAHPALLALYAQEAAAQENVTVARKTRMPSVDVRAAFTQIDDLPLLDRVRDGRVGVYLKMPLFDKGAASANTDKVRFSVAGIQEKIRDVRRTITENLNQAWNIYDAQTAAITAAQASIDANKLALDGVRDAQINGRRTVLDVLNAEQELLNARVALVRAKHNKISAYFAILAAMGKLTPENLGLTKQDNIHVIEY